MSSTSPNFEKLNSTNYATWSGEMQAWLQASGLWRLVNGTQKKPSSSSPPTESDLTVEEAWQSKADKAAGWLYLMVEPEQRVHFNNREDPVNMWNSLCSIHLQKRPGTRFNAYDDLFNIRKVEDESLQSLINRVEDKMKKIKDLRPDGFDLQSLDEELASMTLIRALPAEEYFSFTSSLLLKDKLDKAAIHQAFVTEDIHRRRRAIDMPAPSSAFFTSKIPKSSKSQVTCTWCNKSGHEEAQCNRKDRDRKRAQENTQFHSKRRPHNANKAQEDSKNSETIQESTKVTEFAGNASARSKSPLHSSPLQLNADFHWLADTGATSHMTPHRH